MFAEIAVVKTDAQYRDYVSEIGALVALDPDPSTPEGKRLELLALLVESYEKERYRIPLPNPIDAILFRLEQKGLQQKDLIPIIGSKSRVSEILAGKRRLTIPMVRKLSAHLEIPVSALVEENQPESSQLEAEPPLSLVREIIKRGWIQGGRVTARNAKDFVARLFEKVGTPNLGPAYLRSSIHTGIAGPINIYALRLWVARVLIKSRELPVARGKFHRTGLGDELLGELARLSWLDSGPRAACDFLAKHGIAVVIESHLPGTALDGAAILDTDGTPVIGLTLRYDRLDNFWFTLMHECAHVVRHLETPGETFVDDTEKSFDTDVKEIEANRLARDTLISQEVWRRCDANRLKTVEAINALADELKIHPAIVAGRIRRETGNYRIFSALVGHGELKKALAP